MSRVDNWGLTAILVFIVVVFPFRAWWDLNHPESWIPGSGYDPHVYLWAWAAGGVFIACIALRIAICEWKTRRRKVRLARLYVRAEQLIKEKKWQEAESVLQECQRLVNEKYI
jgi:hypothetical protein